jgi:hypothetical protein
MLGIHFCISDVYTFPVEKKAMAQVQGYALGSLKRRFYPMHELLSVEITYLQWMACLQTKAQF